MIEFDKVCKNYGSFNALTDVTAEVTRSEVVVLCGPSGSGKSTLLRTVNRLETLTSGSVRLEGIDVGNPKTDINSMRKRLGFVFQQYNLFPHLTATDNIAIGLTKLQRMPRKQAVEEAVELLARVGLSRRRDAYPGSLSGGEQQRVAIARSLSMKPDAILFDEPTAALDVEMAADVLSLIKTLRESGITMMCVTHEMNFAREVADEIWFMSAGRLVERAAPAQFFGSEGHELSRKFLSHARRH